jgi:hypothetical protein
MAFKFIEDIIGQTVRRGAFNLEYAQRAPRHRHRIFHSQCGPVVGGLTVSPRFVRTKGQG